MAYHAIVVVVVVVREGLLKTATVWGLILLCIVMVLGRDSSVGIATRYGLDSPRIESRWRRVFLHPSRPDLGPSPLFVKGVPFPCTGSKAVGAWFWPTTPSTIEVEKKVEMYLYTLYGPSWPVLRELHLSLV
jgi:hypothetical protein